MESASEELADTIVRLLTESGLIVSEDSGRYQKKVAAGSMKGEDWLVAVEKAIGKEQAQ